MDPFVFLEMLQKLPGYAGQIIHVEEIPASPARFAEPERPLLPEFAARLNAIGTARLYTHQAAALDAVRAGRNVVVVTGTASGKTLCYNIPVVERMLANSSATALYLFPTKALAQNQCGKLTDLQLPSRWAYGTYDGDTASSERSWLRQNGRIILSNVDMLHHGMLPRHTAWGRFFRRLEFVVVDEMHAYRGVFGSNVALVLRRLNRICRHYGSHPVFIFTSATIGNPGELAAELSGQQVQVIDDDGSPHGPRKFVFWNPPVTGNDGRRRSAHTEAAGLLSHLVEENVRNITFAKARKSAEIILRFARQDLQQNAPELVDRVMSYRAGYRPEERREIEEGLFSGKLLGVVATDALELGVDVGGLDATVLTGFPGTISSAWQQAGRAGRGEDGALSVMIGLEDPLDQYLMNHPDYFFGRANERVLVNPQNPYILAGHLACAAYEIPLAMQELEGFGPDAAELAWKLAAEEVLDVRSGRFYWMSADYPAARVSIRSSSREMFRIITESREEIGTVEAGRAFKEVHPGAIYLHAGETYRVKALDLAAREALVERGEFDYYTRTHDETTLRVLVADETYPLGAAHTYVGRVEVTSQVLAYRRVLISTGAVQAYEPLDLPEQRYETDAVWWTMGHSLVRQIADDGFDLMGAIHAIEHAAISLSPIVASCDRWDLGGVSHPCHPDTGGLPSIFIYDGYPGGVGIARALYGQLKRLLTETAELLLRCPCESGCPSCIQSPKCGNNNEPLDKAGALRLVGLVLAGKPDDLSLP